MYRQYTFVTNYGNKHRATASSEAKARAMLEARGHVISHLHTSIPIGGTTVSSTANQFQTSESLLGGILGGLSGYFGGGGAQGAIEGFAGGYGGGGAVPGNLPGPTNCPGGTSWVNNVGCVPGGGFVATGGGGAGTCPSGTFRNPITGNCVRIDPSAILPGGAPFISSTQPYGAATHGRYGIAMVPAAQSQTRLSCPRGMVLGMDNLCYNRRDLRKDERKWVPPRKPLLTGGDLNAISRAARAAGRMEVQKKRLEKLGLLKKPTRRR
jgi:hypothetical protein